MKISLLIVTACLTLFGLAGCKASPQAEELPAVIANIEPKASVELNQVVAGALGRESVNLADDALTRTDRLIIERKKHQSIEGGVLVGRSYEMPQHFRLVIKDSTCILIHEKTETRYPLKQVSCRALKTD